MGIHTAAAVVGKTQSRMGEAMDVSPDGKFVAFVDLRGLVVADRAGVQTVIAESGRSPRFSPDGRWLAYAVNPGGIEVERFPEHDFRVPASSDGNQQPQWRRDGKELFYPSGPTTVSCPLRCMSPEASSPLEYRGRSSGCPPPSC
jgi:Tol biopolymer transport system component